MSDLAELRIANARLTLGLLGPEALPAIAASALELGLDSPSLRIVAGLLPTEVDDAQRIFASALDELGVAKICRRGAVILLAQEAARQVLVGQLAPIDAARRIWDLSLNLADGDAVPELDSFVYAASEWDERPEDRQDFESGIVEASRSLLNRSA